MALNVFQSNNYENSNGARKAMQRAKSGQVSKVGENLEYCSNLMDRCIFGGQIIPKANESIDRSRDPLRSSDVEPSA